MSGLGLCGALALGAACQTQEPVAQGMQHWKYAGKLASGGSFSVTLSRDLAQERWTFRSTKTDVATGLAQLYEGDPSQADRQRLLELTSQAALAALSSNFQAQEPSDSELMNRAHALVDLWPSDCRGVDCQPWSGVLFLEPAQPVATMLDAFFQDIVVRHPGQPVQVSSMRWAREPSRPQ